MQKANLNQQLTIRTTDRPMCVHHSLCTTGVYNTAQNGFDNLPSYPPDSYHCSDVIYWTNWMEAGMMYCNRLTC